MRIIQRYILTEIFFTWLAVTLVLLLILISNRFVTYLADAASGEIPANVIFTLLGLRLVGYFGQLAPFSFFIALLLSFGRMSRDSEMAALGACGVGGMDLLRICAWLLVPLSLFLVWLSLFGSPWANKRAFETEMIAKSTAELSGVRAGRFQGTNDGNRIFFIERVSKNRTRMEGVFVEERGQETLTHVSADIAYQKYDVETGRKFLVLEDGYRYEGMPGQGDYRVVEFVRQTILIEKNKALAPIKLKYNSYPTVQLFASNDPKQRAELHWRLSVPVSMLLLGLLGIVLSKSAPREGKYARLIMGAIIFTIYANFLIVGRALLEQERVPAIVGLWWVHFILLALVLVLMAKQKMFARVPQHAVVPA